MQLTLVIFDDDKANHSEMALLMLGGENPKHLCYQPLIFLITRFLSLFRFETINRKTNKAIASRPKQKPPTIK